MPPKRRKKRKRSRQKAGFLNRYDFACARIDIVNQGFKNLDQRSPAFIKDLTCELNNIVEQRIHQVITEGGTQLKQVGPQLLKGAIEVGYKAPFKLLGKFGKSKLNNNDN